MPELALSQIIANMERDTDTLIAPIGDNWKQGRTAFGGYTGAVMLEAAMRLFPDQPPLRSAMVNFTGPVTEPPRIHGRILRQGRNMTMISIKALNGENTVGAAIFSFGKAQDSDILVTHPAPQAPAPEDTPVMIDEDFAQFVPRFHTNFDIHLIEGGLPMGGFDRAYMRGWARHRDPASRKGLASLFCIADILPPAIFPLYKRPGPNSSVNWICNFMAENPQTEDGWWHAESTTTAGRDGYSSQVMRIWNTRGELVVDGMQSVLTFV